MAIKTNVVRWIARIALVVVGLWSVSARAAAPPVPATLTQQGRILDTAGTPVSSKVAFVFTLYDSPTASAAADVLWTETQNITLDDGYFSAQLGAKAPIPAAAFDGSVRYLGVTVGGDAEMTPRQQITSVPYAILAGTAAEAAVADKMAFTGLTGIPAVCPAGQYLKGFTAAGAATCGTLPALSCQTVIGTAVATTSTYVGCPAGTVTTGGGCYSDGAALRASYIQPPCTGTFCFICGGTFACAGDYVCTTVATANITPYARCCAVQ